ncbi:MAG: hypothetical protein ACYC2R_04015 [Burkholderiales bacterium]
MKSLRLDQLLAGMVLAQDVCDPSGSRLLTQGTALSEAAIGSLKRRGVKQVVVSEEETLTPEQQLARKTAIRERIDWLFRHAGKDPMLFKLHATILHYRLLRLD